MQRECELVNGGVSIAKESYQSYFGCRVRTCCRLVSSQFVRMRCRGQCHNGHSASQSFRHLAGSHQGRIEGGHRCDCHYGRRQIGRGDGICCSQEYQSQSELHGDGRNQRRRVRGHQSLRVSVTRGPIQRFQSLHQEMFGHELQWRLETSIHSSCLSF